MNQFKPTQYTLQNVATGRFFEDTGWMLSDPLSSDPSLIRAIYSKRQIELHSKEYGIYKFADWLPISRVLKGSSATVTYKSDKLAQKIGMNNLYISFSGYWPDKGAFMRTCSFKETEAYSVCGRWPSNTDKVLVVASAGNTARAFAQVCSENGIKLLLCVPEDNIGALWFKEPINDCVKLICSPKGSDYYDAIALSQIACNSELFTDEGGARNVARRDGMGTTVLSAATFINAIPDAYFQAVGSGTGTIAAWEANLRLIEDGRFGSNKMKLFPSQNIPFTPMYDAWKAGSRTIEEMDGERARKAAAEIDAKVLSNRKPPYSIKGGLFDSLTDANGDMEVVDNSELREGMKLFKEYEGIDIHPAAAVALVGMIKSLKAEKVSPNEIIMLNITGGGEELFKSQNRCHNLKPSLILDPSDDKKMLIEKINSLF